MTLVAFGEWRPDVSDFNGEHSRTIKNVFPRGEGYGPIPGLSAYSDALPAACRGLFAALNSDGTITIFAGTATNLYKMDNGDLSWDVVSKTSGSDLLLTIAGDPVTAHIGDMTNGSNLEDAFDGDVTEAAADGASKTSATSAYAGVTFDTETVIRSCVVYGSNDAGFVSGADPNVTLTLYAKLGDAPEDSTDGTIIGTLAPFSDSADESGGRTLVISDPYTAWKHVWVKIDHDGSAAQINIAEISLKTHATYAVGTSSQWQFAQFGSKVIAVLDGHAPQTFTLGTDSAFADLSGSPPQAAYVTVIGPHLVLSGLTSNPFRIAWSATDDATGWTAGTDGSDTQDFQDGGVVRGVAGGEFDGLIFQDNTIRRMNFIGGQLRFEITRITNDKGSAAPYSIMRASGRTLFLSASGLEEILSGGVPIPIGKERFDRTFLQDWDAGSKNLTIGAADPKSTRVFLFYKSNENSDSTADRAIVWDWALQRGAYIDGLDVEYVAPLAQPGDTLEGLDSVSSSIDALTLSLDDFSVAAGAFLAFVDTSHKVCFLSGETLEAMLDTPDIVGERRVLVRGQRPVCDSDSVRGLVQYRQRSADEESLTAEATVNSVGFIPHRIDTRHARFRNRIPAAGDWTFAIGVEPDMVPTGAR